METLLGLRILLLIPPTSLSELREAPNKVSVSDLHGPPVSGGLGGDMGKGLET